MQSNLKFQLQDAQSKLHKRIAADQRHSLDDELHGVANAAFDH